MRIRAFREHLKEIHTSETEQRAAAVLAARLSRLWRSTGPGISHHGRPWLTIELLGWRTEVALTRTHEERRQ